MATFYAENKVILSDYKDAKGISQTVLKSRFESLGLKSVNNLKQHKSTLNKLLGYSKSLREYRTDDNECQITESLIESCENCSNLTFEQGQKMLSDVDAFILAKKKKRKEGQKIKWRW